MKKIILLVTFLIYFFSVIAEAGVISNFVTEKTSNHHSEKTQSYIKKLEEPVSITSNGNSGEHCTESSCHIGHCHHVSTAAPDLSASLFKLSQKFSRIPESGFAHMFTNKLKRPPRLS